MRLIDADALQAKFIHGRFDDTYISSAQIIEAPTVDADPVRHGRWEFLGANSFIKECMCGTCSVCKVRSKYIVNAMLCPNCGAKMDGSNNNATN